MVGTSNQSDPESWPLNERTGVGTFVHWWSAYTSGTGAGGGEVWRECRAHAQHL